MEKVAEECFLYWLATTHKLTITTPSPTHGIDIFMTVFHENKPPAKTIKHICALTQASYKLKYYRGPRLHDGPANLKCAIFM